MWLVSSGLGELEPLGLRAMALDLLRASLPVGGQALTLYEKVHPQKQLANRDVQPRFLQRLAQLLPAEAAPIIVADSGFKVPFCREVERLGWRFRRTMEKQPFAIDALGILPDRQPDCFPEESAVTIGNNTVNWPMMDCHLPAEELAELRAAHRGTRDKREADRIKVARKPMKSNPQ